MPEQSVVQTPLTSNLTQGFTVINKLIGEIERATPTIAELGKEQSHSRYSGFSSNVTTPEQLKDELSDFRKFLSDCGDVSFRELIISISTFENLLGRPDFHLMYSGDFAQVVSKLRASIETATKPIGGPDIQAGKVVAEPVRVIQRPEKRLLSRKRQPASDADITAAVAGSNNSVNVMGELHISLDSPAAALTTNGDRHDSGAATGMPPPKPTMNIELNGDKVNGRAVECNTPCILSIEWGSPDEQTITSFNGEILEKAKEQGLEVVFVLYRGRFKIDNNKNLRIKTKFTENGFESPVKFNLTAPTFPDTYDLWLEMEIQGLPSVRLRIKLKVVTDITLELSDKALISLPTDLGKLIESYKSTPPPDAILEINSVANPPYARLVVLGTEVDLIKESTGLQQGSIADKLGQVAASINNDVATKNVWNLLADPLNPTDPEKNILSSILPYAASAGYGLYDWLETTAGIGEILNRINMLTDGSRITIRSNGIAIPWEAIYPERCRVIGGIVSGQATPSKFWGYRFIFETLQSPGIYDLPEGDVGCNHLQQENNKLTAILNSQIDSEQTAWRPSPPVSFQRDFFTKAKNNNDLQDMNIGDSCMATVSLIATERAPGQMIYFYCHGGAAEPYNPAQPEKLKISDGCMIKVDDIDHNVKFTSAPVVFLNSCSSAALSSISFDSFCSRFLLKGAQGLVATSFQMPAQFAAHFGSELVLRYMKAEETLGKILLGMRRKALDNQIPIGLFYMLRCPSNTSLKRNI